MQPLPRDFLTQIAREYDLSEEQTEVFVEIFSSNHTQQEIADNLHISSNALRTRMTGVYTKFSFGGRVPNKSRKLHDFLSKKYQKSQLRNVYNTSADETDLDALVAEVRKKISPDIKQRCGTMQVLDMTQPIGLGDIYTDVNILETITARSRKGIAELNEIFDCSAEEFHRFGLGKQERRISGLEAVAKYPKLMIWGKPGAGKTTFLKYLAMQCAGGKFQGNLVPIFITLKNFAESAKEIDLITYIEKLFQEIKIEQQKTKQLLEKGKALILLDGLDEVNAQYSSQVIQEIQGFADKYYLNNFAITCRIAAKEYTFQRFIEIEVADFDKQQIKSFTNKWFRKDSVKVERFITKLEEDEPIEELAKNPLLLTLLCLVFGEVGNFPTNRGELYEEGVDVLLKKWDAKRNIERDQVYKKLSLKRKENLLSNIAFTTFNNQDYFFKQRTIEKYIADYISNLPDAKTDPEALLVDSNAVLKSIEAQHGLLVERAKGIYSFSHLTFQEYFTAKEITESRGIESLKNLAKHVTEKRWREVFLLVAGIMKDASDLILLMKGEVDSLVAEDNNIQEFLVWVRNKSNSVEHEYKIAVVRTVYFSLSRIVPFSSLHSFCDLNPCLSRNLELDLSLFLDLGMSLFLIPELDLSLLIPLSISKTFEAEEFENIDLSRTLSLTLDSKLKEALQKLKNQLPDLENRKQCEQWWQANAENWSEELRAVMIKHRNIGHDWQFSEEQQELLEQYENANQLLVDCLNSDCYITKEVRQEIEDTLLLPMADIRRISKQLKK